MFTPELANFSGFTGDKESYVSIIRQKTYININEKGADAGPATGIVEDVGSNWLQDKPPIICDKPFVYFIIHRYSGAILLGGILRKP